MTHRPLVYPVDPPLCIQPVGDLSVASALSIDESRATFLQWLLARRMGNEICRGWYQTGRGESTADIDEYREEGGLRLSLSWTFCRLLKDTRKR